MKRKYIDGELFSFKSILKDEKKRKTNQSVRSQFVNQIVVVFCAAFLLGISGDTLQAQEQESKKQKPKPSQTVNAKQVAQTAKKDLEKSLAELTALREKIANEKVPLNKELNTLESELIAIRRQFEEVNRTLDSRNLDLNNFKKEIKAREKEESYLSNLFDEYVRNFESQLHISELKQYQDRVKEAKLAPENTNLSPVEQLQSQAKLVEISLDRLGGIIGGTTFPGTAVDPSGDIKEGTFALIGPVVLFASKDGSAVGMIEQKIGSSEPSIVPLGKNNELLLPQIINVVTKGEGILPFDPSLGDAVKIEKTQETLGEHLEKGGVVVWPLLFLAGIALLIALIKWIQFLLIRGARRKVVDEILDAVQNKDQQRAIELASKIGGPVGEMLRVGVEHINQPKELVEEVMYEKMLEAKLKLQSWLPFISVTASAAPLLGLLGTVTGIIKTFKLITVFGAGDAKSLSSGISEALITTEIGLVVAIPTLLLYAYLSRKASGIINMMEKVALAFLNRMSMSKGASAQSTPVRPQGQGSAVAPKPSVPARVPMPSATPASPPPAAPGGSTPVPST